MQKNYYPTLTLSKHPREQQVMKVQDYEGQHLGLLKLINKTPISGTDAVGDADTVDVLAEQPSQKVVEELLPGLLIGMEVGKHGTCLEHKIIGVPRGLDVSSVCQEFPKDPVDQCERGRLHNQQKQGVSNFSNVRLKFPCR